MNATTPNPQLLRQTTLDTLSNIEGLPTLPDLFLRIQTVLNEPESTLQDLTQAIERDQIVAATIVKVANSSYYNPMGKPATSLSFAISRLGRDETSHIALSMALLYGFSMPAGIATIRSFWAHAFAVGQICRRLSTYAPSPLHIHPESMFLIGLLHDIGRAILGIRIDTHYFEQPFSHTCGIELAEAEKKAYGVSHDEAGALVLQHWGFPEDIYIPIQQHHHAHTASIPTRILKSSDTLARQYLPQAIDIESVEAQLREPHFDAMVAELLNSEHSPFYPGYH